MSKNIIIKCSKCNNEIDVNNTIFDKLRDDLNTDNEIERNAQIKKYKEAMQKVEEIKINFDEKVLDEVKKKSLIQEKELREYIKKDLENENIEKNIFLKKELEDKNIKINELNLQAIENRTLKDKLENLELDIRATLEIKYSQEVEQEKLKIKEKNELRFKEKDEKFKQLQEQLEIVKTKSEQGSMQLQGEVQELAIEEFLDSQYPFDTIEEIKKGERGADCIQIINTRESPNCGKIYYESKRAKNFQKEWIEKFKNDMIAKNIDIGVLVTQTLPKELERIGLIDGIWICTLEEFKGLSMVLREGIIKTYRYISTQVNRKDKMNILYDYLTSSEFGMNVESINETYEDMTSDLDKERRAMNRLWKEREKKIKKLTINFDSMYGAIKGIAGNSIKNIESLELGFSKEKL